MNRLTERKENGVINVRYATEHETAIHRLAAIEDILGDEYDLERLKEAVKLIDKLERICNWEFFLDKARKAKMGMPLRLRENDLGCYK